MESATEVSHLPPFAQISALVFGTKVMLPAASTQTRMLTMSPTWVYLFFLLCAVTVPVASSSVLPAVQEPWPGELTVVDELVVCLLGDQVTGPPDASADVAPDADTYCAFLGLHFEIVMLPVTVPATFLHDALEPEANADCDDEPTATVSGTAKPRPITAESNIRRICLPSSANPCSVQVEAEV